MFKFKKKNKNIPINTEYIFNPLEIFNYIELEMLKSISNDYGEKDLINIEQHMMVSDQMRANEEYHELKKEIEKFESNKSSIYDILDDCNYDNDYDDDLFNLDNRYGRVANNGVVTNSGRFIYSPGLKPSNGHSSRVNVSSTVSKHNASRR